MRAIQITECGGPEVLRLVDLPDPVPTGDLRRYQVLAAGVNYADTHQAENSYLAPQTLPMVPGAEFVGLAPDGTRVVGLLAGGGYAEWVLAAPALTWPVPDSVDDGSALGVVLQGATAWHLLCSCAHLVPGETVVVQAAAGGVGTLAVQLAKEWGAGRVVGIASTEEKRRLALELGADAVVDPAVEDLTTALREANGGRRIDVVLEMTGGRVCDQSMAALAPFGRLVVYGMASRAAPSSIEPNRLMARSQAVIGFWLAQCFRRPAMLDAPIRELLDMVADQRLRVIVGQTYPLDQAAQAHQDLRTRRSIGKLVLDPRR